MNTFEKHKAEAQEKWGQTEAYRQHEAKTRDYSQQKWSNLEADMDGIMASFARCLQSGKAPESAEAQALVKNLQTHITQNYYHCTDQILSGLGRMYVADERFQTNIDKHAHGTAAFISQAIIAHCKT